MRITHPLAAANTAHALLPVADPPDHHITAGNETAMARIVYGGARALGRFAGARSRVSPDL